jgi:O-Antigen ligase
VSVRSVPFVALAAAAGLLVSALFFGGGTDTDRLLPIALAALFVAGAAGVASLAGLIPAPRTSPAGVVFLGLLVGIVVWSGLSVDWSVAPDHSWDLFNRELAYLAFTAVGLYAGALLPRPLRLVGGGLALALGALVAWALAGKVIPALFPGGAGNARLRSPVGHWNGLALLADMELVLALWVATDGSRRRLERSAAVVLCFASIVAVVLTYSRSGIAIAVLAAGAWVVLSGAAFEALVTLALAVAAAAPVLTLAFLSDGVTGTNQPHSTRVHDGAFFGLALVSAAVVVGAAAFALLGVRRVTPRTRRLAVRAAGGVIAAAVVIVLAVLVVRAGGPGEWLEARAHDFSRSSGTPTEQSSRLGSLSSNHRWEWWQEAWRSFEDAPAQGRGAGSFPVVNLLERRSANTVAQPHNLLLQALSDTGIVGFLLLAGAITAAAVAIVLRIRGEPPPDRAAALALAIAAASYFVQSLFDVDWDFVALSGLELFVLGVLIATGTQRVGRSWWALAATGAACAAAASLLLPWLAARKTGDAYAAIGRDPAAAVDDANAAHALNPLTVEPLYALASARAAQRRLADAEDAYARAIRLQPQNPDTWYELASFELDVRRARIACAVAIRALRLDPFDRGSLRLRERACR